MARKIARANLKTFIERNNNGKIMSAVFVKQDQTERQMNFRLGVEKNLAGGSNKVEALDRSYQTVYDMNEDGYRTLNLSTVKTIKINKIQYEVV